MNQVVLMGRLTKEPEIRGTSENLVARYTLAVDRKFKKEGQAEADFISCVAFGKLAEHTQKYYKKGTKICLSGRIQTGSYKNKDGQTVYTTDVIVDSSEFAESKSKDESKPSSDSEFMNISPEVRDDMPF